jgi:hypothetical protein
MKFPAIMIGLAIAAAVTACGSASKPSPSASPTQSAAALAPSPSTSAGTLQGGYGNTNSNTGTTYACEFQGLRSSNMKTVIDYVAVTGHSQSEVCSLFDSESNYRQETSLTIPRGAPVCWMTAPNGKSTARFYPPPGGSRAVVKAECAWQFQDLGK